MKLTTLNQLYTNIKTRIHIKIFECKCMHASPNHEKKTWKQVIIDREFLNIFNKIFSWLSACRISIYEIKRWIKMQYINNKKTSIWNVNGYLMRILARYVIRMLCWKMPASYLLNYFNFDLIEIRISKN